jgi:hypothetical protein
LLLKGHLDRLQPVEMNDKRSFGSALCMVLSIRMGARKSIIPFGEIERYRIWFARRVEPDRLSGFQRWGSRTAGEDWLREEST